MTLPRGAAALRRLGDALGRGDWALLLGVGVTSVLAQLLMTEALQHVRVGAAGVITQLTAVLTIGAGAFFLGDRLSPTSSRARCSPWGASRWWCWGRRRPVCSAASGS